MQMCRYENVQMEMKSKMELRSKGEYFGATDLRCELCILCFVV